MNYVDATCEHCGQSIRWQSGTRRLCAKCLHSPGVLRYEDGTIDKPYQMGNPERYLTGDEAANLTNWFHRKVSQWPNS